MNESPVSAAEPLPAESFGATAMSDIESEIIFKRKNLQNTYRIYSHISDIITIIWYAFTSICPLYTSHLKAVLFSAPSHPAASRWRCPRPRQLLSSSGLGCCSCSHAAPGAPCAPAGFAVTGPPSPDAGLLPGSRPAPPRTLPAGHGSPAWLLSAVTTGWCDFMIEWQST